MVDEYLIMPTPLFPENDTPIFIRQGKAGNCYMLAALDCIFNSGPESYQLIKGLFTNTTDNTVTVRLKHSAQSDNIKPHMMAGKYTYFHDLAHNEDVFILNEHKLHEIDVSTDGVLSNSLAVKILERLFSYYYEPEWDIAPLQASLFAHNISEKRYEGTSTAFVGKLLGIEIHEHNDIDEIIKLKSICPDQAVYISMSYGNPDQFGKVHTRHALRLDKVIPTPGVPGEYQFYLVNPWNNQTTEVYSLAHISTNNSRFCIYKTDPEQYKLTQLLLNLPVAQGQYIATQPELLNIIGQAKKLYPALNSQHIEKFRTLHQQVPYLPTIFNSLSVAQQKTMMNCIFNDYLNKNNFITQLLIQIPEKALLKNIIGNDPAFFVQYGPVLADRSLFAMDFELYDCLLENGFDFMTHLTTTVNKDLALTNLMLMEKSRIPLNIVKLKEIEEYVQWFNQTHPEQAFCFSFKSEAQIILEQYNVLMYLAKIESKTKEMELKAETDNDYQEAAQAARILYTALVYAKNNFLASNLPKAENITQFKDACFGAMNHARIILEIHRGWKQVFSDIANVFLSVTTLGLINLATGQFRFFAPPTDSIQKLNEMDLVMQQISVTA